MQRPTEAAAPPPQTGPLARLKRVFRALHHRNYRLFFFGQGISLVGTWLTRIATAWLVYRLTGSSLLLGVVTFAGQIPVFLLSPLAGVLVDRWDIRRLLVVVQSLAMVQSLILAALTLSGVIRVWEIMALAVFQGLLSAFETPARQAFAVQMVADRADLGNAIALNSMLFNGARLLGPAMAGFLIALAGEGVCFLLDGLSYIAVIAALLAMQMARRRRQVRTTRVLSGLREGLEYAARSPSISALLLLLAVNSLLGAPYAVLLPVFATRILHGGAHTYGLLASSAGLGALAGGFFLASRERLSSLVGAVPVVALLYGMSLLGFALARSIWLAALLLAAIGFAFMVQAASTNTLLQSTVEDDKRGRVMSLYATAVLGVYPFGSLLAGVVAARAGAPMTVAAGALLCLGAGIVFLRVLPRVRAHLLATLPGAEAPAPVAGQAAK